MALERVVEHQRAALDAFERSRVASARWSDDQRLRLDRSFADPLRQEGGRLLNALVKASEEITRARQTLSDPDGSRGRF